MRFSISPASESKRNAIPASNDGSEKERKKYVANGGEGGEGPEKEVNDEAEEAEGGRCESSALTLGFDARP